METSNHDRARESQTENIPKEICIQELSATLGYRPHWWSKNDPNVFIRIIVGEQIHDTRVAKKSRHPCWDESFTMFISSTSSIEFQVWRIRPTPKNYMVGTTSILMSKLRASNNQCVTTLRLVVHKPAESGSTIRFCVSFPTSPSNTRSAHEKLSQAEHDVKATAIIANLERVLISLDKLTVLLAGISEITPYSKVAWGVFSFVYKVAKAQLDRDTVLNDLLKTMADMLELVHSEGGVAKLPFLKLTVASMVKQVEECSKFVSHYTRTTGFARKAVKNLFSDCDRIISDFKKSFALLHQNFNTSVNISASHVVTHMNTKLSDLYDQVLLDKLHVSSDGSNSRLACLDGTRVSDIDNIVRWIHDDNSLDKAFLLKGLAGAGKTAVANSIVKLFRDGGALGAVFFFDRADAERNNTRNVIRTMARALAAYDPSMGKLICAALKKDPSLANTHDIHQQFKHLILDPAYNAPGYEKVIIVLDALDECEDIELLLELLSSEWYHISSRFRLIMTSRSQPSVTESLKPGNWVLETSLSSGESLDEDIHMFVKKQFAVICERREIQVGWPRQKDLDELVQMSKRLFIWIKTACDMIRLSRAPAYRLVDILEKREDLAGNIDKLYLTALEAVPNWDEPQFRAAFFVLFGILMTAKIPLSLTAISDLAKVLELLPLDIQVKSFLSPVGCLLEGLDVHGLIHTLHPSFHDFLTCKERSTNKYHIDREEHNRKLTVICLTLLNKQLKSNICGLKNATIANADILHRDELVETHIPEALGYAAQFIIHHLLDITNADSTINELFHEFVFKHLLEWLEVLSLLNSLNTVHTLRVDEVRQWAKKISLEEEVHTILDDFSRFLWAFMPLLKTHALQVYSSALLFTPSDTVLSQKYTKIHHHSYRSVNLRRYWSSSLATLEGHDASVLDVVFSPDGTRLASASWDHKVRLWDAHSGMPIGALIGHTDTVNNVAFSPDGSILASSSKDHTIRLWNAHSGFPIGNALVSHTRPVEAIAFSPDGRKLASASWDKTIQLWDIYLECAIGNPLTGHTDIVMTVVFSPDGTRLASASLDHTIGLWNADNGKLIHVLIGHTDAVRMVVFSPDGKRLASGSKDCTVRLWNAQSGHSICNALIGHTETVRTVMFSPNGNRLASASWDNTIRLWDGYGEHPEGVTLIGHSGIVMTAVFSPDGEKLASASEDCTVRLWNANSGTALGTAFAGHTKPVMTVVFSPNGKRLASASWDCTIRLWDVYSKLPTGDITSPIVAVTMIVFSQDGTKAASASEDHRVNLWDVNSGHTITDFPLVHTKPITTLSFALDGTTLAVHLEDSSVSLWDSHNGQLLKTTQEPHLSLFKVLIYNDTWINEGWLEFNGKPILWIPSEYRGRIATFNGNKFSIGCSDGKVLFIEHSV